MKSPMADVKSIVAKNIAELRVFNNMTQMELAEKLNYSDKTISKWERGESSPDISVLVSIAEIFGVTLDELVQEERIPKEETTRKPEKRKRNLRAVSYVAEGGSWMLAVFAFVMTTILLNEMRFQWLYLVYALPVALIVKLVLNSIWFNPRHNYLIISALMWSVLVTIHVTFLYFKINVALVYLLGIAGQVVIILWSNINKPRRTEE